MEKLPENSPPIFENGPDETPLQRLKEKATSFFQTLTHRISEGLGTLDEAQLERIQRSARKSGSIAVKASMLLALGISGLSINHIRTRYEISEQHLASGEQVYAHEDERTTDILNYLLGKEELSTEDKKKFYRFTVRETLESHLYPVPENLNDLSEEELVEFLVKAYGVIYPHRVKESLPSYVRDELDASIENVTFDRDLYEAVWELQKRVGSPRIRWAAGNEDITASVMSVSSGNGRAFYDPVSNTVYLTPMNVRQFLITEDAHAQQFNQEPIKSYARLAYSWVRTGIRSIATFEDLSTSYSQEYNLSRSLENEAHEEIAPKLVYEVLDDFSRRKYPERELEVAEPETGESK